MIRKDAKLLTEALNRADAHAFDRGETIDYLVDDLNTTFPRFYWMRMGSGEITVDFMVPGDED